MKRYLGWFVAGIGLAVAATVVAGVLQRRCRGEQAVEEPTPFAEHSDDTRQPVA